MSTCFHVTMSPCHHVNMSTCHPAICQHAIMPSDHYAVWSSEVNISPKNQYFFTLSLDSIISARSPKEAIFLHIVAIYLHGPQKNVISMHNRIRNSPNLHYITYFNVLPSFSCLHYITYFNVLPAFSCLC